MQTRRLIYQNWIVDLGFDPATGMSAQTEPAGINRDSVDTDDLDRKTEIDQLRKKVTEAVEQLDEGEREFISQFYYLGFGYRQISEATGRRVHKLEALHQRSLKRLRQFLAGFVEREYGIKAADHSHCPICSSNYCDQIDRIIAGRDKTETWRPVMRKIYESCGLYLRSPQILIGHEKYHLKQTEKKV